jgi:integrase/recombinase XerD
LKPAASTPSPPGRLCLGVASAEASSHWRALRLSVVRGFAAYLHTVDPTVQVPPAGLVRSGVCRATPYLYSTAEISSLLHAATELRPCLRAATYQSLIGLLAVSGIRIGEGIALDVDDLDTHADLLLVREAKFALCRNRHNANYVAFRIMSPGRSQHSERRR